MTYTDAQLMQIFAYAMRDHAEIVSGAYKLRNTQIGVEPSGWRDKTDEEKLKDAIQTMEAHCRWISDLVDAKADEIKKENK